MRRLREPAAWRRLRLFLMRRRERRALAGSVLFDADFYRASYPELAATGEDPLTHYVRKGAREGRNPNPWFDSAWYLDTTPALRDAGVNPLLHYLREGASQGFDPSPRFETRWYLARYPDVAASGANPLEHFLTRGEIEGRLPRPDSESPVEAAAPLVKLPGLPPDAAWADLPRPASSAAPEVDVIVPVYGRRAETLNCLLSVLRAPQRTPFALVVIDDAGPDPALAADLDRLAGQGWFTLLRNAENLGFVGTVNRGMALHPARDVVLLNTDTEVHGDWLDRLCAHLAGDQNVGTVTPFSNNAEICSYPRLVTDNDRDLGVADAALDAMAAQANAGRGVEIPTGVGFCMLIARRCLEETGPFDVARFGRGYGEENDFCRRAAAKGWRHLLAGDVFVRHYGGASFGGEKAARVAAAMRTLDHLYPDYHAGIKRLIRADPMRPLRAALDRARVAARTQGRALLMVSHGSGGGTQRHVEHLRRRLEAAGRPVVTLTGDLRAAGTLQFADPQTPFAPNLPRLSLARETDEAVALLREVGVAHIHVHHLLDAGPGAAPALQRIAAALGVPCDVTVHDYFGLCPRVNLIDGSGLYCGEPEIAVCERCVAAHGSPVGRIAVAPLRAETLALWQGARALMVPDADVAARLARYLPEREIWVRPHEEAAPAPRPPARAPAPPGAPRRVALIGALGPPKGSAVLAAVAAAARDLPLHFVVAGWTDIDRTLRALPNVTVLGRYREAEAMDRIAAADADLAWFPNVWPETYSYTLSLAFAAGLMPVAFDLGAIAARIARAGFGRVVPLALAGDPRALAEMLLTVEIAPPPPGLDAHLETRYPDIWRDYYGILEGD